MDARADSNVRQSALAVAGLAALAWLSTLLAMQIGAGGGVDAAAFGTARAGGRVNAAGAANRTTSTQNAGTGSPYALVGAPPTLRYDTEYPTVRYTATPR